MANDIGFWAERWREGRIGFHEGRVNAFLERHVDRLGAARRVLVPLCGKTEDLAFLASRGHAVVGIEAVEDAVKAFFREHDLTPEVTELKHARSYTAGAVTILAGDFFAVTAKEVGAPAAFYDRAAIVALAADVRPKYVSHLRTLLAPDATGLVVTFEYDPSKMQPPPFAVPEAELRALYAGATLELIDGGPAEGLRFAEAGVAAHEKCFAVALSGGELSGGGPPRKC
jgi:thiopurine S-methyltransferase